MINKKKEYIKKIEREQEILKDEDGKSIINIKIEKEDDILSPFSMDKPIISNELAEFLDHHLRPMVIKNGIHLQVYSLNKLEKEKEYESAIRNYYKNVLLEKNREIKKNKIISLFMLIFGTLILTLSIIFSFFERLTIVASIIDIIAWVFIWEAVDLHFLQRPKIELEELKAFEMINSKITFKNLDN